MLAFFNLGAQEMVILLVLIVGGAVFAAFMVLSGRGKDGGE